MKRLVSAEQGEEGRVEDVARAKAFATLGPTTRELNAFYTLFPLSIRERDGATPPNVR